MNEMIRIKTIHIVVTGRVQGVGFRYFTVRQAQNLGLSGWVRNLPDGRVEAAVQGHDNDVETLINLLRIGPASSEVTDVKIEEIEHEAFSGFAVRF
ncbi:MAG TPA: acylphosphatase [Methanosarcinales archaeon]|nr:acylphosphatase [Methanosarcinales archaeon]